jgi:glycolate oxidase
VYDDVLASLADRLRRVLDAGAVMTQEAGLVVLPSSAEQVQTVVRECARARVPVVPRGAGARPRGGALPAARGVLVVTSRMRRIVDIDLPNQRVVVEPGVAGDAVTRAVGPAGFTVHQVTGLEICTPDGELLWLGSRKAAEAPGPDVVGAFAGTEGTLGIATKVAVRLLRAPEAVTTVLAGFRTAEEAGAAVSAIIAAGLTPATAGIMDVLAIGAAGQAVGGDYPLGAGAVLTVTCDGPAAEVAAQIADVETLCRAAGALALRRTGREG